MDLARQARSLIAQALVQEGFASRASGIQKAGYVSAAKRLRDQATALNAPIDVAGELARGRERYVLPTFNSPYSSSSTKGSAVAGSLSRFSQMAAFVKADMIAPASIVQFDSCVRATLKFPLPCTDANIEALTYRDDV